MDEASQAEEAPRRGLRWKIGTAIGVVGLVGFAVLGIWLLVALFCAPGVADRLFFWPVVFLGIGVVGMVIAGAHGTRGSDSRSSALSS